MQYRSSLFCYINRNSPEGEFPIKMKDSNVPMAYKDNITLLSIYIIICLISKNKLITLFL